MKTELIGKIVDIENREIYSGKVEIEDGRIANITRDDSVLCKCFILPGLVDSHIHIESSMLVPSEFARAAVVHGTVATVSDPHEIANVLGTQGIDFMISNARQVPFKFNFGVPSCVPATGFESSGAVIDSSEVREIFNKYDLKYLSEMMNFPGVIYDDAEVENKLQVARGLGKLIDGHSPGLKGIDLQKYISKGISTDHECFTLEEALEKIALGMKILIREGSAAKNFDNLQSLITSHPDMSMLCSDDRHPDDLIGGHINLLVKKAIKNGHNLFDVLQTAIVNPIKHYKLDVGLLREGDYADLIVIDDFDSFNILQTYIDGNLVAENGVSYLNPVYIDKINVFNATPISENDIKVEPKGNSLKVISAIEGELITEMLITKPKVVANEVVCDTENDILKLVVYNRYSESKPAVAFIKNFNLRSGALATSVAHDSHNIIAVGASDSDLVNAINKLIGTKGGMTIANGDEVLSLPLPIAGIMSDLKAEEVAELYSKLNKKAISLGTKLKAPFMTLSFMALLVIPKLKLSDKGLFDGEKFCFTDLFEN